MHRVNVKHGIRTHRPGAWPIAVVAMIIAAAMSGSCFLGTATNLCETSDRRCSPGQTCAAKQDVCIEIGGCGDGIVSPDKGEVCDDGGIIDGDDCSADCKSDESCGNGITDAEETCDDGNRASGDGCSANCFEETCGDGFYNPVNDEQCDTGGDTQACNGNGLCTIPRCGDGYANIQFTPFMATAPEECDIIEIDPVDPFKTIIVDSSDCNGNNNGFEGPGSCRSPLCGDSYTNTNFTPLDAGMPEECDTGNDTGDCNGNNQGANGIGSCRKPSCGDGYANPNFTPPEATLPEQCDTGVDDTRDCNGNNQGVNGIGSCRMPLCGDGYINREFMPLNATQTEACDNAGGADTVQCNGNNKGADGPGSCAIPRCGDGYTNTTFIPPGATETEACDNGATDTPGCNGNNKGDNGPGSCQTASCGDDYINTAAGENCEPFLSDTGCNGNETCRQTDSSTDPSLRKCTCQ